MTIRELYEWAAAHHYEDYTLASAGAQRGYEIHKSDIEVKESPDEELMRGEVWL